MKINMNKTKIIGSIIALVNAANIIGAAETLTISAAHALPDYRKFSAAAGTVDRALCVAFAVGDFNQDGRKDLIIQTANPDPNELVPFGAKVLLQHADGAFVMKNEFLLP